MVHEMASAIGSLLSAEAQLGKGETTTMLTTGAVFHPRFEKYGETGDAGRKTTAFPVSGKCQTATETQD